jgi:hypothetical protein
MKNSTGKNWYSGDKITKLVEKVSPENSVKIDGITQDDSNYEQEMYSDEQLAKHAEMDNIYKVDNVPSRWEHNKTRSTWHFDPFADPREQTFIIPCRFVGNFKPAIDYALEHAREYTIGNYRARNLSKQDQDLHDGEIIDIVRASGKQDVSCMYHDRVAKKQVNEDGTYTIQENRIPEYEVLFNMIKALDVDVHQSRLHIQRLGQVTPFHIDQQMRYARSGWRKIWTDAGADKNPLKLRRFLIMLQDWDYGHVWQFGNTYYQGYRAGECVTYDWCNMPHGTANFGYAPRITFQITGFVSDKTQWMMDNPDSDRIINV